jgi:hypothetical protein
MSGLKFDASRIIEGAASEPPFLVQLASGARHIVAALTAQAEWRSRWTLNGVPLTDGEWDIVEAVAATIPRSLEDGENVDELSDAIRYLADSHNITHSGGNGGGSACCGSGEVIIDGSDFITERDPAVYGPLIQAVKEAVVDSFVDTGSNYPPEFLDRAGYEQAKCLIANQLYRDFRETMINLEGLNLAFVLATFNSLMAALLGSSGMVAGLVAVGLSAPLAIGIVVGILLALIAGGVALGVAFYEVGQELDKETFVCAMFEAESATAAKAALLQEFQDAHDRAIASGALTLSAAFEGGLLEIVAIMAPSELMEALFSLAGAGAEFAVAQIDDYDCASCGDEEYVEGQQLLVNPNYETDLSGWTQHPAGTWTWESSPQSVGRGRIDSSSGGSMEQHFTVTQQMIDDGWDLRFQSQVRGSSTGSSAVIRVFDETDTIVLDYTKTAGDTKTFSYNTITESIPLTVGDWSIRTYVGQDDVIEYQNVFLTKVE